MLKIEFCDPVSLAACMPVKPVPDGCQVLLLSNQLSPGSALPKTTVCEEQGTSACSEFLAVNMDPHKHWTFV